MNLIKNFKKQDKYSKYSILIIVIFSLIVLSLASVHHISGDGCWHITVGKYISKNSNFPLFEPVGRDEPFWSPPLYHIIVAAVYGIFNSVSHEMGNFAVKFVSPVFGILTLIVSFLVIKKLINSKIAFYSLIFLAFIPIFIDYSVLGYVESTLTFFAVLSVYFMIKDRIYLSAAAAGLAILTKYNGVFILPVLLFFVYKKYKKKDFIKNGLIIAIIPFAIAAPWFLRNWILLGNPIWPFLNFVFRGFEQMSYSAFEFTRLISIHLFLFTYFGFFGVPDGNIGIFSKLQLPVSPLLFLIWIIGTIIFIAPVILGIFRKIKTNKNIKKKLKTRVIGLLVVWILSYFILFLMYVPNVGFSVSRIILPGFPALAVFFAFGLEKAFENKKLKKITVILLSLVIFGFVGAEFVKFSVASMYWGVYEGDFEWARENTESFSTFAVGGQCIQYNIERESIIPTNKNLEKVNYVWVNQEFILDSKSILAEKSLSKVKREFNLIYENPITKTKIYGKNDD